MEKRQVLFPGFVRAVRPFEQQILLKSNFLPVIQQRDRFQVFFHVNCSRPKRFYRIMRMLRVAVLVDQLPRVFIRKKQNVLISSI